MATRYSAALPVTYVALRILILLNWLMAAAILALLLVLPHERWIMTELHLSPSPEAERIVRGLRWIAALFLAAIPLNHVVLARLLAMTLTVRAGDPFVAANARRLSAIAWALLGIQLLALAIVAAGRAISTSAHPLRLDGGLSIGGWIAVLLSFVLARIFAQGTEMRDDLRGTI